MSQVITELSQATPEWLTIALRRAGSLTTGHVTTVQSQPVVGRTSHHLTLTYSADASPNAPERLFLKMNAPALRLGVPGLGKQEVAFYQAVASRMTNLPVPHCYDAFYSDEADCYHLLLGDFSATHLGQRASQLPPDDAQSHLIVEALARVHAAWWQHPALGVDIGHRPTAESIRRDFQSDMENVSDFLDFLGDRLSPLRRAVYARIGEKLLPLLLDRLTGAKPLTLIFEDVHIGNFLFPRDPLQHSLIIIDWEQWDISIGANDLSYMMAVFWFPERRARLEKSLLEPYLKCLLEFGVTGYTWDDLWYDYRLSVIRHLLMPAWRWKHNSSPDIWWNHLERLMLAYKDLNCRELL